MKTAEILAEVSRFPAKHCVLTGGEPMIARGIHDLAAELAARGFHITIETAGTMPPAGIICHLASISPKMPNSTPHPDEIGAEWIARHEKTRHRPGLLAEWTASYPFQLKFVVAREDDAREALEYVDKERPGLARDKIFLMPEGTTSEVLRQREEWLIGFCQDTGCRFGDRLHIRLFGNKRGT